MECFSATLYTEKRKLRVSSRQKLALWRSLAPPLHPPAWHLGGPCPPMTYGCSRDHQDPDGRRSISCTFALRLIPCTRGRRAPCGSQTSDPTLYVQYTWPPENQRSSAVCAAIYICISRLGRVVGTLKREACSCVQLCAAVTYYVHIYFGCPAGDDVCRHSCLPMCPWGDVRSLGDSGQRRRHRSPPTPAARRVSVWLGEEAYVCSTGTRQIWPLGSWPTVSIL